MYAWHDGGDSYTVVSGRLRPVSSDDPQMRQDTTTRDVDMITAINTDRLVLRNYQDRDAAALLEYRAHPTVHCFARERLGSLAEAQRDIREKSGDDLQLAVCTRDDDRLIGSVFAEFDQSDTYGVGWNFNPTFVGLGYATEAAIAFLNHLFHDRQARRIYAYVEDDNLPSQHLCERLGMRQEALYREFISFVNNADGTKHYENTREYAILRKEWQHV